MVMAPGQFPRRSVPHFALMLIEAFLYVQFVPLTPKQMRHKHIFVVRRRHPSSLSVVVVRRHCPYQLSSHVSTLVHCISMVHTILFTVLTLLFTV